MKTATDSIAPFHLFCITVMYNLTSVLVFRGYTESKNKFWIAIFIAGISAVLCSFLFLYISNKYPGLSLFTVLKTLLGEKAGKIVGGVFALYALFVATRVIKSNSSLITTVSLDKTPEIYIMIMGAFICVYALISGLKVLGKFSMLSLLVTAGFLVLTFLISIKNIEKDFVVAKTEFDFVDFLSDITSYFCFPFAENVFLYDLINKTDNLKNGRKAVFWGLCTSVLIIGVLSLYCLSILGIPMLDRQYYTFYSMISVVNFGVLISRIEIIVSIVLVLSLIIKYAVCLYVAAGYIKSVTLKGKSSLFYILLSSATIIAALFFGGNNEVMTKLFLTYKLWAPAFQLTIPVVITVITFIKSLSFGKIKHRTH